MSMRMVYVRFLCLSALLTMPAGLGAFTVTPRAGEGGTIRPAAPQEVRPGATQTFTITPQAGYTIATVAGCGGRLAGNTYTTGPVMANCTVTATFERQKLVVMASVEGSGSISPAGPQIVPPGKTLAFRATPSAGNVLISVSGCGGALSGDTFTTRPIDSSCNVKAVFAPVAHTLRLSSSEVTGGRDVRGSVDLNGAAPGGGITVNLSRSTSLWLATVPPSVTISAGEKSADFQVETRAVPWAMSGEIIGSRQGVQKSAALTLKPPSVVSFEPMSSQTNPPSVYGGAGPNQQIGILVTDVPAPGAPGTRSSFEISLSSSDPNLVLVPQTINIAAGEVRSYSVAVTPFAVQSDTAVKLTAGDGLGAKSIRLTVKPQQLRTFEVGNQNILDGRLTTVGGWAANADIRVHGLAWEAPITVELSSNNPAVTLPASVTVQKGQSAVGFDMSLTPVQTPVTAILTAKTGQVVQQATIELLPPTIGTFNLQGRALDVGTSVTQVSGRRVSGEITLAGRAPDGGLTIPLSSSGSAATPPSSCTIPAGSFNGDFQVETQPSVGDPVTVEITAGEGSGAKRASLTLLPIKILEFRLTPEVVTGGGTISGEVVIEENPAGGVVVPLSSSIAAATVPESVTVPEGQIRVSFQITTSSVDADTTGTITAGSGSTPKTKSIIVRRQ